MVNHLISVLRMQILVEKIAKLKGIDSDMPRNLANLSLFENNLLQEF